MNKTPSPAPCGESPGGGGVTARTWPSTRPEGPEMGCVPTRMPALNPGGAARVRLAPTPFSVPSKDKSHKHHQCPFYCISCPAVATATYVRRLKITASGPPCRRSMTATPTPPPPLPPPPKPPRIEHSCPPSRGVSPPNMSPLALPAHLHSALQGWQSDHCSGWSCGAGRGARVEVPVQKVTFLMTNL